MRRIGGENSHTIAGVFVFLLLGVFAVFSTMLVLFGAQAYRTVTERSAEHEEDRTLYAYVLNSLRGEDAAGAVGLRTEDGIDMVTVAYDDFGESYEKRMYCYDGYLREMLMLVGSEFNPGAGEQICAATDFQAQINGNLITIEMTGADGETHTVQTILLTMR